MYILGIETSCDETGVAIYSSEHGVVAQQLHSQIATHEIYGGVVPELASREHIERLSLLVTKTLNQAQLSAKNLTAIAFTNKPGLVGALLVGAAFAKSFAYTLNIPAIPINHLEAHLLAAQLEKPAPDFPFLTLLVSGGHTQLIIARNLGDYEIIGDTRDDAAGEAFDKIAKLMGLGLPGGAKLAKLATQGNPKRFQFPTPMLDRPGFDFSFSGLKTHALLTLQQNTHSPELFADVAHAFERAVVTVLTEKCSRALIHTGLTQLVAAGGVACNLSLRKNLLELTNKLNVKMFFPRLEFCTDNGAMIAYAGYLYLKKIKKYQKNELKIEVGE